MASGGAFSPSTAPTSPIGSRCTGPSRSNGATGSCSWATGATFACTNTGFTRYYLNLDADGNAYRYTGSCYVPTSLDAAIEHVFDGLEEMGETRSSVWDHRALRRRYEALSRAGWTVVGLGGAEDGAPD
jgi:hypothetical protein